jgi:predicted nucleic acid-binding protein
MALPAFLSLYIDTNPLIYAFEGSETENNLAIAKLVETLGPSSLMTSELTLSEMLVKPFEANDAERIRRYKGLLQREGNGVIRVHPVSTSILIEAAWHRGEQSAAFGRKLKLPDAIHLATATFWGCSHFMSKDERFGMPDGITQVRPVRSDIDALMSELRP